MESVGVNFSYVLHFRNHPVFRFHVATKFIDGLCVECAVAFGGNFLLLTNFAHGKNTHIIKKVAFPGHLTGSQVLHIECLSPSLTHARWTHAACP